MFNIFFGKCVVAKGIDLISSLHFTLMLVLAINARARITLSPSKIVSLTTYNLSILGVVLGFHSLPEDFKANQNPIETQREVRTNQNVLVRKAEAKFGNISNSEQKLLDSVIDGQIADFSSKHSGENDPSHADNWGADRVIRSELVSWLFEKEVSEFISRYGVRIRGARIEGLIDLYNVEVDFGLECTKCALPDGIQLESGDLESLYFSDSVIGVISGYGSKFGSSVILEHIVAEKVQLNGATIGGHLSFKGATFPSKKPLVLSFVKSRISGNVFLDDGFVSQGGVDLSGSNIEGQFSCTGGSFQNPDDVSLNFDYATIRQGAFLGESFKTNGRVRGINATIGTELNCRGGNFGSVSGIALNLSAANIDGSANLDLGFAASDEVNLAGATINGQLSFRSSRLACSDGHALVIENAEIKGHVFLDEGVVVNGEVNAMGVINPRATCLSRAI